MAQEPPRQDLPDKGELERQKLDLEVKELASGRKGWGKVVKLLSVIAPSITLSVAISGVVWTIWKERAGQRQEIVTNLKREVASDNPSVRISAARALADYPREATHLLITCLGTTRQESKEEDRAFTNAVKDALRQIGKGAVNPLIAELRRTQGDIRGSLARDEKNKNVKRFYYSFPFSIFDLGLEKDDSEQELRRVAERNRLSMSDEQIKAIQGRLSGIKSSRHEEILCSKNGAEVLANILRTQRLKRLGFGFIDLSGAFLLWANLSGAGLVEANLSGANLTGANLSGANLTGANLSGANLTGANLSGAGLVEANLSGANLTGANLSGAGLVEANLSGANLTGANLSGANLAGANLSGAGLLWANLSGANLRGANLDKVKWFREVEDFKEADLRDVKGLSREDLEYAKSRGAIVDEKASSQ